jgi:hypothetical protein
MLFQLAVSSFNWRDKVIKDVNERVWRILTAEASHNHTVEDHAEDNNTVAGITKKYRWWIPKAPFKEKNEAAPFVGKSTLI